jgi:hypothetical protein
MLDLHSIDFSCFLKIKFYFKLELIMQSYSSSLFDSSSLVKIVEIGTIMSCGAR